MNQQEQARIQVLNSVLEYQLPIAQAAEIMGVSERHTKRPLAAYRKGDGADASLELNESVQAVRSTALREPSEAGSPRYGPGRFRLGNLRLRW